MNLTPKKCTKCKQIMSKLKWTLVIGLAIICSVITAKHMRERQRTCLPNKIGLCK